LEPYKSSSLSEGGGGYERIEKGRICQYKAGKLKRSHQRSAARNRRRSFASAGSAFANLFLQRRGQRSVSGKERGKAVGWGPIPLRIRKINSQKGPGTSRSSGDM